MYEIEVRALVEDFNKMKEKLDNLATKLEENESELTIYLANPHKPNYEIRIRVREEIDFLCGKDSMAEKGRKTIQTIINEPEKIYKILTNSGYTTRATLLRKRYFYEYNGIYILLSDMYGWGYGIEVVKSITNKSEVDITHLELTNFIKEKLGINKYLTNNELQDRNKKYNQQYKIDENLIEEIIDKIKSHDDNIDIEKFKLFKLNTHEENAQKII